MTSAADLRACLSDDALRALADADPEDDARRAFVLMTGEIAGSYGARWREIVEAAPVIAERACHLLRAFAHHQLAAARFVREDMSHVHALHTGEAGERAAAACALSESGPWPHPFLFGMAGASSGAWPPRADILDGRLPALALAIAAEEVFDAKYQTCAQAMAECETLEGHRATHLIETWDRHFETGVLPRFIKNARTVGMPKGSTAAYLLVASAVLRGRMRQRASGFPTALTMHAGAAASRHARTDRSSAGDTFARRLGAASLGSAFGFRHGWTSPPRETCGHPPYCVVSEGGHDEADDDQEVLVVVDGAVPLGFTRGELQKVAALTAAAAVIRLREEAADPRHAEHDRLRHALLTDAVDHAAVGARTESLSFARLIGLPESAPETAGLREGAPLYDAAPVGSRPPVLRRQVRGKELRCRAVADERGRLAGYRAYDVLSDEFHGEPLHAVFDLDGHRVGYLEDGRFKAGEPSMRHFITVPKKIAAR